MVRPIEGFSATIKTTEFIAKSRVIIKAMFFNAAILGGVVSGRNHVAIVEVIRHPSIAADLNGSIGFVVSTIGEGSIAMRRIQISIICTSNRCNAIGVFRSIFRTVVGRDGAKPSFIVEGLIN